MAAGIKQVVDVPVVAVGAITSPEDAVGIVEEGKADLVALGRPSIADPHLPRKLWEGRASRGAPVHHVQYVQPAGIGLSDVGLLGESLRGPGRGGWLRPPMC